MKTKTSIEANRLPLQTSSPIRHLLGSGLGVFAVAALLGNSQASTHTFYFNAPSSTNNCIIFQQSGGGYWVSNGGSPNDPEAVNQSTNGYFALTDVLNYQRGVVVFPDFDPGFLIQGFKFSCDVRIGGGTAEPADGFSICLAAPDDPVLVNQNGTGWAAAPSGESDLPEEGTQTGLAVCFDTHDNAGGDVVGMTLRVNNMIVTNIAFPYANLDPNDPNFTASLQTGTNTAGLGGLTWQPLSVEYTTDGLINVTYKGIPLLRNFVTSFSPMAGRLVVAGRNGALNEYHHMDNIRLETFPGAPIINHFTWSTSPSAKVVDVPFPVTITAKNLSGVTVTSFTDTVALSGYAAGLTPTNLTIGTGAGSWDYPMHTSLQDARTQVIYTQSELGGACVIHSLALEVATVPGQIMTNWTIRMKHTSLAEYSVRRTWESIGWTVVYQGDEPQGTTGWRTFFLNTPFAYNGTENLLIDFSFNNASHSAAGQCRCTTHAVYRSIYFSTDNAYGDPLTWSGPNPLAELSQNVPNLVLGVTPGEVPPPTLTPAVTTPFVSGIWTGTMTVHEPMTNMVLWADDGAGHTGESDPFDVQAAPPAPAIVTNDGQLGVTNGHFGFNVEGQVGQVVVVEVSTNLVDWLPSQTNTLGGDPFYFSDPDITHFTKRFYRAVTP